VDQICELKAKIEALLVACDHAVSMESLARCLDVTSDEADEALREFEADLLAADRGIQLRRRPHGVRIETKPQYTELIGRLLPERRPKPLSSQSLETLAIVALKQPVSAGDINAIRGIESASSIETLRNRKLIARSSRLGSRRERTWRTTAQFLEVFGLASIDELYKEGRMEEVFASVYGPEMAAETYAVPSNPGATGDIEAPGGGMSMRVARREAQNRDADGG
jgi:segregation and condensation protein B